MTDEHPGLHYGGGNRHRSVSSLAKSVGIAAEHHNSCSESIKFRTGKPLVIYNIDTSLILDPLCVTCKFRNANFGLILPTITTSQVSSSARPESKSLLISCISCNNNGLIRENSQRSSVQFHYSGAERRGEGGKEGGRPAPAAMMMTPPARREGGSCALRC